MGKHITQTENKNTKHKHKYKNLSPLCRRGGTRWCKNCTRQNHKHGKHKHKTQKKTLSPLCRRGGTRWCRSCTRSRAASSQRGLSTRRTGCSLMCIYGLDYASQSNIIINTVLRIACRDARVIALSTALHERNQAKPKVIEYCNVVFVYTVANDL